MHLETQSASEYPLADLVQLLNRGFENYFVPIQFNLAAFLNMLRKDSVDLLASRVLLADKEPSGIALIARRGWVGRLAAMAIVEEKRGNGAGTWFMQKLLQEARERKEREMVLEVIEQNEAAVRLYQRHGFQIVRRLVGWVQQGVSESKPGALQEIDLREMGRLISQYGLSDLPWQLSAETLAQMTPPVRAFCKGQAYVVLSNPDVEHVVIFSLLVEPDSRGQGLGTDLLKSIIARYPGKTWHVPAIFPEEFVKVFERAGFQREELSQWQMLLSLQSFS
jgi:ribosomal protein S18 acetylase RimI-like enzyme